MTTSPGFARVRLSIVANHGRETNFQPESDVSKLAMAGPELGYERQDATEKTLTRPKLPPHRHRDLARSQRSARVARSAPANCGGDWPGSGRPTDCGRSPHPRLSAALQARNGALAEDLAQRFDSVGALPGELWTAEVAVSGSLAEDRALELEGANDASRAQVEDLTNRGRQRIV